MDKADREAVENVQQELYDALNSLITKKTLIEGENFKKMNSKKFFNFPSYMYLQRSITKLKSGLTRIKFIININDEYNQYNNGDSNNAIWDGMSKAYRSTLKQYVLAKDEDFKLDIWKAYVDNLIDFVKEYSEIFKFYHRVKKFSTTGSKR